MGVSEFCHQTKNKQTKATEPRQFYFIKSGTHTQMQMKFHYLTRF